MDRRLLRVFQQEVEGQCRFGLLAASDLAVAVASGDMHRLWYSAQALLVAAGNVSKLLWPPNPKYRQRGRELRASLGVKEDSPLAPRTFRNHFEHFDERLEDWATSSNRRNLVDSSVVPAGAIQGVDPGDFLRNLDPDTYSLTFRGDAYDLRAVIGALQVLHDTAKREAGTQQEGEQHLVGGEPRNCMPGSGGVLY